MYSLETVNWMIKFTRAIAHRSGLIPLSLGLAIVLGLPSTAQTPVELYLGSLSELSPNASEVIFDPPTEDKMEDSRGGASRNPQIKCRGDRSRDVALTALIPETNEGLTLASHPTFFVYVPPTASAEQIYFNLKDENRVGLYQTRLPISGQGELVKIQLPTDQPPLEIGETYQWSVGLICQQAQTDMPTVTGTVQRAQLDATFASQLAATPSIEQAAVYAKLGIWYDTLTTLFHLKQLSMLESSSAIDPTLVDRTWLNLLNSVGLEAIANQPFLEQP